MLLGDFQPTRIVVAITGGRRPIAVLDGEAPVDFLAGRGLGGVEEGMILARVARRNGNPEVRRARVEIDGEVLAGRPNGDGACPLKVVALVCEGYSATLAIAEYMRRQGRESLDLSAQRERVTADVALEVDQVLAVFAVQGRMTSVSNPVRTRADEMVLLLQLDELSDSLVVVEDTVCVLQRSALVKRDTDTRASRNRGFIASDGCSRRKECESDSGNERGFAEHTGGKAGVNRRTRDLNGRPQGGRREGEKGSW